MENNQTTSPTLSSRSRQMTRKNGGPKAGKAQRLHWTEYRTCPGLVANYGDFPVWHGRDSLGRSVTFLREDIEDFAPSVQEEARLFVRVSTLVRSLSPKKLQELAETWKSCQDNGIEIGDFLELHS